MARIGGSSSIDIDAPVQRCFDLVSDPEGTCGWQDSLKGVRILERDADGEPTVVETQIHAMVKDVKVVLEFDWDEPHELRWKRRSGEVKDVVGAWTLEDLGDDRTRATYSLEIDPGRVLGMLTRGPIQDQIKKHLTAQPPKGLKAAAESSE